MINSALCGAGGAVGLLFKGEVTVCCTVGCFVNMNHHCDPGSQKLVRTLIQTLKNALHKVCAPIFLAAAVRLHVGEEVLRGDHAACFFTNTNPDGS
jgi:hypothetical protein